MITVFAANECLINFGALAKSGSRNSGSACGITELTVISKMLYKEIIENLGRMARRIVFLEKLVELIMQIGQYGQPLVRFEATGGF